MYIRDANAIVRVAIGAIHFVLSYIFSFKTVRPSLNPDSYHGCTFLQAGNIIEFENKRYKVDKLVFRLEPPTRQHAQINIYSDVDPWEANCQLSVIVSEYIG